MSRGCMHVNARCAGAAVRSRPFPAGRGAASGSFVLAPIALVRCLDSMVMGETGLIENSDADAPEGLLT